MRCIEKRFEFLVGNGILIDVEGIDMHEVLVEASWRIFPWILDVHALVVSTFDFDSCNDKEKVSPRNMNHLRWWKKHAVGLV